MLQKRCKFITNFSSTSNFLSFFYIHSENFFFIVEIIASYYALIH